MKLISSLITASKQESSTQEALLSLKEIFDEISLLTFAGFETTLTAISWLAPRAVLTQKILDLLVYVECVAKEVFRLAPIYPCFPREATQDDNIDGIEVKKGDTIMIAIQNIHRDPRNWKMDPSKFIPERFLGEDKDPSPCAWSPFGDGHRACDGQDLAFFELKVVIARLMQRVTFYDPSDEANNSGGLLQRLTSIEQSVESIL